MLNFGALLRPNHPEYQIGILANENRTLYLQSLLLYLGIIIKKQWLKLEFFWGTPKGDNTQYTLNSKIFENLAKFDWLSWKLRYSLEGRTSNVHYSPGDVEIF